MPPDPRLTKTTPIEARKALDAQASDAVENPADPQPAVWPSRLDGHDPYCALPWHGLPCTCQASPWNTQPRPPTQLPKPDGTPADDGDPDAERIRPAASDGLCPGCGSTLQGSEVWSGRCDNCQPSDDELQVHDAERKAAMPDSDIPTTVPLAFVAEFLSRLGFALTDVHKVTMTYGRIEVERYRHEGVRSDGRGQTYLAGDRPATVRVDIAIESD